MIREIFDYLVSYAPALAKSKFSGVHYIEGLNCYRVHKFDVIPKFAHFIITNDIITHYINRYFSTRIKYDEESGWFSILK